jgi:ribosomal protein L40E
MELSAGIRKLGFRRWYERQLIESHLYLISGFLSLVMVLASLEDLNLRMPTWETLLRLAALIGGSAICLWTVRRYLVMLDIAEYVAERSVCVKCAVYGGLDLGATAVRSGWDHAESGEGPLPPVRVRCRKCGHEWMIE